MYIPELGLDLGAGGVPAPGKLAKRKLRHHGHCVPALSGKNWHPGSIMAKGKSRVEEAGGAGKEESLHGGRLSQPQSTTKISAQSLLTKKGFPAERGRMLR